MHVNKLPDIILIKCFHWIVKIADDYSCSLYDLEGWKTKLVLLSVCKLWRELALPCVHKTAFISCLVSRVYDTESNTSLSELSDLEDWYNADTSDTTYYFQGVYTLKSNMDIISKSSNSFWPGTIQIRVSVGDNHLCNLHKIIDKIREHSMLLKHVKKVDLIIIPNVGDENAPGDATCIEELRSVGEEFCKLIPSVQYIHLSGYYNWSNVLGLATSLLKGYAHQLRGFNCPHNALEETESFSNTLRHINLRRFYASTGYMPQVCAENLTVLSLSYIEHNFDWSSFENTDEPCILNFANLKALTLITAHRTVDFPEDDNYWYEFSRKFNYKVVAPKLEYVFLDICPFTVLFLASTHCVSIKYVKLELRHDQLEFTQFDLDAARDVLTQYAKDGKEYDKDVDNGAFMNDIFNIYGLAKSNKACADVYSDPIANRQIDWKYLVDIKLVIPFYISDFGKLIQGLPNVEHICINDLQLYEATHRFLRVSEESALKPIDSKLKTITVSSIDLCTHELKEKLRIYLQKLFPNSRIRLEM